MSKLIIVSIVIVVLAVIYFFSFQAQSLVTKFIKFLSKKVGHFAVNKEYALQRYVFLHRGTIIARSYNWVNEQLIAVGLKRIGVSPVGYVLFWSIISIILSSLLVVLTSFSGALLLPFFILILTAALVITRVVVSGRIEHRESVIMNALDLIIPEVNSGIKNVIQKYLDNFDSSIRGDFRVFLSNIQDRGYSFNDAMFILADSLGEVFRDFAQKAMYFEAVGEPDMQAIFEDIVEINRLRRDLRTTNEQEFKVLRVSFIVSSLMDVGYFIFLMMTDAFSKYFFLSTTLGNILLVSAVVLIFGVLSYLSTLKSRAL